MQKKTVSELAARPVLTKPEGLYREQTMRLLSAAERLQHQMREQVMHKQAAFREAAARLRALDPLGVLLRGYGVAYDQAGNTVSTVDAVKAGETVCFRLHDGMIHGRVEQVERLNCDQQEEKNHEGT
jgi:exodeoxyribonuclease VII large subunit